MYKRLENGSFLWPRSEAELKPITWQQFRWLMEGLQIEQKQSIKPAKTGDFC
jgi:transposase